MMRTIKVFILASLTLLSAGLTATAQQTTDWASLVKNLSGKDAAVREATFKQWIDQIMPKLCSEKDTLLIADIPGLLAQFAQKEDIARLQVSALLGVIGNCRSDSAAVLAEAIPTLIDRAENDSFARIRLNSVRTLADLKPEIPATVVPVLVRVMHGHEAILAAVATYGIAREVKPGSQAEDLVGEVLSQKNPGIQKKAAMNALVSQRVTDPVLMKRLGDVLMDPDVTVVKAALNAISHLGDAAITPNRAQLASLAQNSTDSDIVRTAKQLLERDANSH
ncbi:MAG: hypothetical protein JO108_29485 [Acidobacteriaceae bacterium]|nr:hypothetical protein [Acidobacteriaceae bacterium]